VVHQKISLEKNKVCKHRARIKLIDVWKNSFTNANAKSNFQSAGLTKDIDGIKRGY
jgi:hypothetical protein